VGVGAGGGADNDGDHMYANATEVSGVAKASLPFSSHHGRTKF